MLSGPRMKVSVVDGTRAAAIYQQPVIEEEFSCNYGLNAEYQRALAAAGLCLSGFDEHGEVRMAELSARRFYLATLFLPQLASTESAPHPLVVAFVRAAVAFAASGRVLPLA
jgi:CTP synthase (UTP-ammonia lyase)